MDIEVKGSYCVRTLQNSLGMDRMFIKQNAEQECSESRRCVGIASNGSKNGYQMDINFICLDSVQSSLYDYGILSKQVFRKATSYGKYESR